MGGWGGGGGGGGVVGCLPLIARVPGTVVTGVTCGHLDKERLC